MRITPLAVVCALLLLVGLDATVLNVAPPTIARSLGASTAQMQWIVDAYLLAFAAALLPAGAAGDRLGRRPALLAGLGFFAAASIACALSRSPLCYSPRAPRWGSAPR